MFSKYFPQRHYAVTYFPKGSLIIPKYENKFDISSRLIYNYSNSGDIETIVGYKFKKGADVVTTILKSSIHEQFSLNFDIETELD